MNSSTIIVREYAKLTLAQGHSSLDLHTISKSAFDWLLEQHARFFKNGVPVVYIDGKQALKLGSFVGYLESPCGTSIEILPKTNEQIPDDLTELRQLICSMVLVYLGQKQRTFSAAQLMLFKHPVSEFIMQQFLDALNKLVRKGLRSDYVRVEEESKFLRGRIVTTKQIRQPISRAHYLQVSYDLFSLNQPENRLVRSALKWVIENTKMPANWRLANELFHQTEEIPESTNFDADFNLWQEGRLNKNYRVIRPWTELILHKENPTTQKGRHTGIALLFAMEELFEHYVAYHLRRILPASWTMKTQASEKHLVASHDGRPLFLLKPDIVLDNPEGQRIVLDTKWKLLNENNSKDNYEISQSDIYQLYAYGQKYQSGAGRSFLIFPRHKLLTKELPVFHFHDKLSLTVVPFCLKDSALSTDIFQKEL